MTTLLDAYDIDGRIGLRRASGAIVDEAGLIRLAASLPADLLVAVAGWLSCQLVRPDCDHRELQRDASHLLLPRDLARKVIALIDGGAWALLGSEQLAGLAQLGLLHGTREPVPAHLGEEQWHEIGTILLALNDNLPDSNAGPMSDESLGVIVRAFTLLPGDRPLARAARYYELLVDTWDGPSTSSSPVDIEATFEREYGIGLEDFFTLSMNLWTLYPLEPNDDMPFDSFIQRGQVRRGSLPDNLRDAFDRWFVADRAWFQTEYTSTGTGATIARLNPSPLLERPFYASRNGLLVPTLGYALTERASSGPYWLLFDAYSRAGRDHVGRFRAHFGSVFADYTTALLRRAYPSGHRGRFLSETDVGPHRRGGHTVKGCDGYILDGDVLIALEYGVVRVLREARLGDGARFRDTLGHVVKKFRQLDRNLRDFAAGRLSPGGIERAQVRIVQPVLIVPDSFPSFPIVASVLADVLHQESLLPGAIDGLGVRRPVIIPIDELEWLEPGLADDSVPLARLLADRAVHRTLSAASPRRYAMQGAGIELPPSSYTQRAVRRFADRHRRLFAATGAAAERD